MRNSSRWLTFDISWVVELDFQELYNKCVTKFENQANFKSRMAEGRGLQNKYQLKLNNWSCNF